MPMGNGEERVLPPLPPIIDGPHTPRRTARSADSEVTILVVHAMAEIVVTPAGRHIPAMDVLTSEEFDDWEVSADAVVDTQGKVHLLNPEPATHYTWHAGRSKWGELPRHRLSLNHISVGVEVLVEGALTLTQLTQRFQHSLAFKSVQYRSTGWLLAAWETDLAGGDVLIVGHSQISGPEVRDDPKEDPGTGFAWGTLMDRMDDYKAAYFGGPPAPDED